MHKYPIQDVFDSSVKKMQNVKGKKVVNVGANIWSSPLLTLTSIRWDIWHLRFQCSSLWFPRFHLLLPALQKKCTWHKHEMQHFGPVTMSISASSWKKPQISHTVLVFGNLLCSHYAIQATALHCNDLGEPSIEKLFCSCQCPEKPHLPRVKGAEVLLVVDQCQQPMQSWTGSTSKRSITRHLISDHWQMPLYPDLQVTHDCVSWFMSSGSDLGWQ